MQFLKTLFWVILAVALVLFGHANWQLVTINLWGGLQADVKLPVLVIGAFLLGFLPTFLVYRTRLWSMRRRLDHPTAVPVANAPNAGQSDHQGTPDASIRNPSLDPIASAP